MLKFERALHPSNSITIKVMRTELHNYISIVSAREVKVIEGTLSLLRWIFESVSAIYSRGV